MDKRDTPTFCFRPSEVTISFFSWNTGVINVNNCEKNTKKNRQFSPKHKHRGKSKMESLTKMGSQSINLSVDEDEPKCHP